MGGDFLVRGEDRLHAVSSAGAGSASSTASSLRWRAKDQRPSVHHDQLHASQGAPNGGEPLKKGVLSRCIGRTKGGLNSKLHVVCDPAGKPLVMLLTEGQMNDRKARG